MISLPVKYRPKTLDEVVGQDFVIEVLKKQIETGNIRNVYLFCGSSGDGKTSTARCFAKAINGGIGEPIEIDAASNNGVDNIRAIVQDAQERAIVGKYKVIILDEIHSLTSQSWQAFLKCIEEPPAMTVFIFCTTDPQKIPETILNRVQRFNFHKIPYNLIKDRLMQVSALEGYTNYEESVEYISKVADGCMREALTLLGKVADLNTNFDINTTIQLLGNFSDRTFIDLINAFLDDNEGEVLNIIDYIDSNGGDLKLFVSQLLKFVIDIAKYLLFKTLDATSLPTALEPIIKNIVNFDNPMNYYNYLMDKLLELKNMIKNEADVATTVRVVCLQIARMN